MSKPHRTMTTLGTILILTAGALLVGAMVPGCSDDDPATPKPTNEAPVGTAETYFVTKGATLTVDDATGTAGDAEDDGVLVNDSDADGDALTAVLVTPPANHVGDFTLNDDGTFVYVHDGSGYPADSFTYTASDGEHVSAEITVTLTNPVVAADGTFGAGTLTRDLRTGEMWLDVTLSTPYSYDLLLPELENGGFFEGYRLATRQEVKILWVHAGIDTTLAGFVAENLEPVVNLMDFVGITGTNGNLGGGNVFDYTAGHIESGPGGGGSVYVGTIAADPDPTQTGRQSFGTVPSDNTNASHGAWLVAVGPQTK